MKRAANGGVLWRFPDDRTAIAYTLIETAKMNNVNPEAWLAWVLERILRELVLARLSQPESKRATVDALAHRVGTRVERPPDVLALGNLGYVGTTLEVPLKTSKKKPLTKEEQKYNTWHSKLRIGVEHGIGRMKKFKIFADIHRNNRQRNMICVSDVRTRVRTANLFCCPDASEILRPARPHTFQPQEGPVAWYVRGASVNERCEETKKPQSD
ncbi:transposase domain-containing protein [Kiloniella sp.]|uniref:transposase domain-containing protein n=1 Tax=Kiloniella sp. TaxID=1938587 RepID=UPI003B016A35